MFNNGGVFNIIKEKNYDKISISFSKRIYRRFQKKTDLSKLDTIEVYDSQHYDVSDSSFTGIYGWADYAEQIDTIGSSVEWKKGDNSIEDIIKEVINQLRNEYVGKFEPMPDGMYLVLKRIK